MIPNIKNGDNKFTKEIVAPVNGQDALVERKFTLIIFTNGPIFPA